jgi:hypothetical protein
MPFLVIADYDSKSSAQAHVSKKSSKPPTRPRKGRAVQPTNEIAKKKKEK